MEKVEQGCVEDRQETPGLCKHVLAFVLLPQDCSLTVLFMSWETGFEQESAGSPMSIPQGGHPWAQPSPEKGTIITDFKKKKYLFIYFWPCWVFIAVLGFSLVAAIKGSSSGRAHCGDLLFPSTGSRLEGFSRWGFSSPGSKLLDQ